MLEPGRPLSLETPRGGMLDALRFLAAAFIVLYHFGPNAPAPLADMLPVFGRGWLATDFFLMLSGYVLGRAYGASLDERRTTGASFFARRIARVWPAQLMVLIGLACLVGAAAIVGVQPDTPARFGAGDFFSQAALIHAWGVTHQAGWNEPSWTLSALVVCYAAFPLIWWACQPLKGRSAALLAGVSLLLAGAAFSLAVLGLSLYDLPFHLGVIRALPLFALGALMARFAARRRRTRAFAVASSLAAFGALVTLQAAERNEAVAFGSIAAIAVIILSADALRLPGSRLARGAADLSFALFITHALSGAVWFGVAEKLGLGASWLVWGLGCLFALGCAWAFHHFADQPIQRALKTLLNRRREPAAQADGLTA